MSFCVLVKRHEDSDNVQKQMVSNAVSFSLLQLFYHHDSERIWDNKHEHEENGFLEKKMVTSSSIIIEQVNGLRASHRIAEEHKHTLWFDVRVGKKSFFCLFTELKPSARSGQS